MDLAAHELPPGSARLEPYQNWLLHDAFYSPPRPEPHPVAAFVLANRGIGLDGAADLGYSTSRRAQGPRLDAEQGMPVADTSSMHDTKGGSPYGALPIRTQTCHRLSRLDPSAHTRGPALASECSWRHKSVEPPVGECPPAAFC